MLLVATSPCTTFKGKERGQPCLNPREREIGADRKPLFKIIEVLFWYRVLIY